MNQKELDKKLELHKLWLEDKEGGVRLDLRDVNLQNAIVILSDFCLWGFVDTFFDSNIASAEKKKVFCVYGLEDYLSLERALEI